MARQAYLVRKGMVFWYENTMMYSDGSPLRTSVQQGRRPYVVVSCDEGNLTAPTCNIAPCTTEEKTQLPVHVDCFFNGKKNTILLEQIMTVDQNALDDFICMLTDETMEQVERALTIQYNIRPQVKYADFKLDNVVRRLESIVEEIIKNKIQQYQSVIPESDIEDSALKLGQMIEDLVGVNKVKKPQAEVNKPKTDITSTVGTHTTEPRKLAKTSQVTTKSPYNIHSTPSVDKNNRIKWDDEKRRQYLNDCDKLTPEQVRVKWGFSSIGTVFSTKYNCKNILNAKK